MIVIAEITAALASAAAMAVGRPAWSSLSGAPASSFGGASSVYISRVGRIDVDLERAQSRGLRRVSCAAAAPGTSCYVAVFGRR